MLDHRQALMLEAFEQAAERGLRAPTHKELAKLLEVNSVSTCVAVARQLEQAGFVSIIHSRKHRVITVAATGKSTALAETPPCGVIKRQRLDEIAEHAANDVPFDEIARRMGVTRQYVDDAWTIICRRLGPQADVERN